MMLVVDKQKAVHKNLNVPSVMFTLPEVYPEAAGTLNFENLTVNFTRSPPLKPKVSVP